MCGFFGWIKGKNSSREAFDIAAISDSLSHRGPDDSGYMDGTDFGIGFRRLSILDLSESGHQPMSAPGKDCHIVFNGEIFNYTDLRERLGKEQHTLRGHSDTEVLLRLLSNAGEPEKILPLLNGMFGFAFVDNEKKEFLIVRDRFGVKPLYYAVHNDTLVFSSELPSLLKFKPGKTINKLALNRYVRFGHITAPDTIFSGIYKLEPGYFLKGSFAGDLQYTKQPWYTIPIIEDHSRTETQWLDAVDELLLDATRVRLISDVPVGIFLSGGIDSSLVAHYATAQTSYNRPRAFSVAFGEKDFNEYEIAKMVADAKKLELTRINVEPAYLSSLNDVTANIGEPYSDSSLLNQYYLSKEARKHATVFLSGDGGDEAFAGYDEYVRTYARRNNLSLMSATGSVFYKFAGALLKTDSSLKQQLSKLSAGWSNIGTVIRNNYLDPMLVSLLRNDYRMNDEIVNSQVQEFWQRSKGLPLVKRMQLLDYRNYLEPDVLVKVDRATMANSIEARSPFLDYRVVELGLSIPNNFNIEGDKGKMLLRKLVARHLPKAVSDAPKKGFGVPVKHWINPETRQQLVELNKQNDHGIWDRSTFEKIVNHTSSSRDLSTIFWRIWMFEIWYRNTFLNA